MPGIGLVTFNQYLHQTFFRPAFPTVRLRNISGYCSKRSHGLAYGRRRSANDGSDQQYGRKHYGYALRWRQSRLRHKAGNSCCYCIGMRKPGHGRHSATGWNGIVAEQPEDTIRNIGRISLEGMCNTDTTILDIMAQNGIACGKA